MTTHCLLDTESMCVHTLVDGQHRASTHLATWLKTSLDDALESPAFLNVLGDEFLRRERLEWHRRRATVKSSTHAKPPMRAS
jgi:hypothetical protein